MKTIQYRYYWLAAFSLLLFWMSRTYNLLTLPLFLDEATHLTRAQWVWEGRPFYLLETGKALAPYVAALFWPYSAAPFIGRYVVVLFGAIGLASAFGVGRELHSRQAGLLCMVLWLVCPQMFFYERMALVDTTMSAMAMLALWLAIRMIRTGNARTAILCGVGLALVVIAKLTGLVFLPIPFLVALLLKTPQTRRRRIRQMVIAYVVAGILLIGPLASIWAVANDPTGQSNGLISTDTTTLLERLGSNAATSWDAEKIYHSEVMLWVLLVSATFAVCFSTRHSWILLALIVAPLAAVMVAAASLWLRYLSAATPFLLLLASMGMLLIVRELQRLHVPPVIRVLPWIFALGWGLFVGLPFFRTAYSDPAQLILPDTDRSEYISWIPSGFGIREAATYVQSLPDKTITIIGTAVNCNSARLYMPRVTPVKFVCPELDWSGYNFKVLYMIRKEAEELGHVYVLGEDVPIVQEWQLPTPLSILRQFPRPGGEFTVTLYRVESDLAPAPISGPQADGTQGDTP